MIPAFIRNFRCYQIRVRFKASSEVAMSQAWYYLPRYALGNALMKSDNYAHLYPIIFRPTKSNHSEYEGLEITPIVIRADKQNRKFFKKNEFIDLYITIIGIEQNLIRDFIKFLPEWSHYNFFKDYSFQYVGYQLYNPKNEKFENNLALEECVLDFDFFQKIKPIWIESLEVKFFTPTTFFIDGNFVEEIPLENLINRLSKRIFDLYTRFISPDSESWIFPKIENQLLLSTISLPKNTLKKSNKNYNLSGILGSVYYDVPYSEIISLLFAMGSFVHIGQHTVNGNGQLKAIPIEISLYKKFIASLVDDIPNVEDKEKHQQVLVALAKLKYEPSILKNSYIPKSNGNYRELSIPDDTDSWLQKKMSEILYQELDHDFLPQNFAFRKGKAATEAIKKIEEWRNQERDQWIIRCDIDDFYDHISIELLLQKIQNNIKDPFMVHLIELWMKSGTLTLNNKFVENAEGIPQGSPLSPILANLYLHEFDVYIRDQITPKFIRYADDILLLVEENQNPIQILQTLTDVLQYRFELKFNKEIDVASINNSFTFLGIRFLPEKRLQISDEKFYKIKSKFLNILNLETDQHEKIRKKIAGYKNYYGKILNSEQLHVIDQEIFRAYQIYLNKAKNEKIYQKKSIDLVSIGGITSTFTAKTWGEISQNASIIKEKAVVTKSVSQKIRNQERDHQKKYAEDCELVITQPGSFLGLQKNFAKVTYKGEVLAKTKWNYLKQISIMCDGVAISSSVTKLCQKKEIHLVFYNAKGESYASIQHPQPLQSAIMQLQMGLADHKKIDLIIALIKNKIINQAKLLKYYNKYYKKQTDLAIELQNSIAEINKIIDEIATNTHLEDTREKLFLIEARAAVQYWKAFSALVVNSGNIFEKENIKELKIW